MINLWNNILYTPLYNLLAILTGTFGGNLFIAIVVLTLLVKIVLLPVSYKSQISQRKLKASQKEIDLIKEKFKDDKEAQAKETMKYYKDKKINPFSSCIFLLIQLPIFLALFYILNDADFFSAERLYSSVDLPTNVNNLIFGADLLVKKSGLFFAILTGVTQFFQVKLMSPEKVKFNLNSPSMKDQIMQSMNLQMRYVLPVGIILLAYFITPLGVAIYWSTNNIVTILQELYIRRKINKELPIVEVITP